MRTAEEIFNEIKYKVWKVLYHNLERDELTVLVPLRDYDKLTSYCSTHFTVEHITSNGRTETTKLMGVTLQPVKDINKIYICL